MILPLIQRISLTISIFLILVSYAWSMPVFSINGSDNAFTVQGDGLEGLGALDVTVGYDPATLSNPKVVLQNLFAGAMIQTKTTVAGTVRIIILANRPGVSGSGGVLTITFNKIGTNPGRITSFYANAVSSTGEKLTPQAADATRDSDTYSEINTSPLTQETSAPQVSGNTTNQETKASSTSSSVSVAPTGRTYLTGTINLQDSTGGALGSVQQDSEKKFPDQNVAESGYQESQLLVEPVVSNVDRLPESVARMDVPIQNTSKKVMQKTIALKSVLNLFKDFRGTKSKDNFLSIFEQASYQGVKQTPKVVIADGKNIVTVSVDSMRLAGSPSFILNGGELVAFSTEDDKYNFDILPKENALEVSITVMVKNDIMIIPLVVTPKLNPKFLSKKKFDEKTLDLFLQEKNVIKSDVNGDGIRDYIDEYIYTANYMAL